VLKLTHGDEAGARLQCQRRRRVRGHAVLVHPPSRGCLRDAAGRSSGCGRPPVARSRSLDSHQRRDQRHSWSRGAGASAARAHRRRGARQPRRPRVVRRSPDRDSRRRPAGAARQTRAGPCR
jgi:hypothetical protein